MCGSYPIRRRPLGDYPGGFGRAGGFEVLLKYISVFAISDILQKSKISEAIQQMLIESLKIPSRGHWVGYVRNAVAELRNEGPLTFVEELIDYQESRLVRPAEFSVVSGFPR
jgi:hypothetical protein